MQAIADCVVIESQTTRVLSELVFSGCLPSATSERAADSEPLTPPTFPSAAL